MRHLDPLPDLFALEATCSRFRALGKDARMCITVGARGDAAPRPGADLEHVAGRWSPTLEDAVARARPGDTILLAPGRHAVARPVAVDRPVRVVGAAHAAWALSTVRGARAVSEGAAAAGPGGRRRGAPWAALPGGAGASEVWGGAGVGAVLEVSAASVALSGVCVVAERGTCVDHRAGSLSVDRCSLLSRARTLAHLFPPLRSTARGVGRVRVSETTLGGGVEAVACCGSGAVRNVRCIFPRGDLHEAAGPGAFHGPLFWFDVVDGGGGGGGGAGAGRKRARGAGAEGGRARRPEGPRAEGGEPGGGAVCGRCEALQRDACGEAAPAPGGAGAGAAPGAAGPAGRDPAAACVLCGRHAGGGGAVPVGAGGG